MYKQFNLQLTHEIYLSIFKQDISQKAMKNVRIKHNINNANLTDIHTSYDGSWQTRGHKSQNGLGCVIENATGLCID